MVFMPLSHRALRFTVLLLLGVSSLAACSAAPGDADDDPSRTTADAGAPGSPSTVAATGETTEAKVDLCGRICAREIACEPSTDGDTCRARCDNDTRVLTSKLRDDYAGELASCIERTSCRDIMTGTASSACRAEARARLSLTAGGGAFCEAAATAAKRCDTTIDKPACLDGARIFSDATFLDAERCFDKSCSDVRACLDASFGGSAPISGSTAPPPPPAPACKGRLEVPNNAACNICMGVQCCDQVNTCADDSKCVAYVQCWQACTTPSCRTACDAAHVEGRTKAIALSSCMKGGCAASCQGVY